MNTNLSLARAIADAVLYEGYLLYPYRASSQKNRTRWQFGILGPPGASEAGLGEDARMSAECLLRTTAGTRLEVHVRFLQLQSRTVERLDDGRYTPVEELTAGAERWLSWDEATERELSFEPLETGKLAAGHTVSIEVDGGEDAEPLTAGGRAVGRLVRRRRPLRAELSITTAPTAEPGLLRLRTELRNTALGAQGDKHDAEASSFLGTHLLLHATHGDFVSLVDPPSSAVEAAATCTQHRCWPVLAGPEGQADVVLVSPIILEDHPAVAPESSVALFDATEIDEILTLRVLTLTEEEKAEARATDPRAAAIIDACEALTPEQLGDLHGALRAGSDGVVSAGVVPAGDDVPWWDPEADASVNPGEDSISIGGVAVSRGSRVRVVPRRRSDAQDFFYEGQCGQVMGVHFDVDGSAYVSLVLEDDPAADLHEWYGRYLYFSPDELEPLGPEQGEPRKD